MNIKLLLISILVFIASFTFVILKTPKNKVNEPLNQGSTVTKDETSIDPYYYLTIPGLRAKTYESNINELNKYQDKPNYTSYLTSYNSDNLKINGLLTIPKDEEPSGGWPAIVFVHGYIPPSIYKTTEKYVEYVDYLARNGFVVFKIDLRGNGSSEGDPSGAYYSGGYVIDTLNAYKALQNLNEVNPQKVGLWGHSMAGNVTFRAFVAQKNIPAIVIWAGAVYTYDDLSKYRLNDNSYRPPADRSRVNEERIKLRELHGDYDGTSDYWKQVVPTNFLEGVVGSIQINHAVDDNVVNVGYSRDLMKILDNTNIEHQLFEYPGGGHNISGANFNLAMKRTVDFFKSKF